MQKKYIVRLTAEERRTLREVVKTLNGSSQKVRRAQMLLKADVAGPAWTDEQIAEAFDSRTRTVEKLLRERFVTDGFEQTLHGKLPQKASYGENSQRQARSSRDRVATRSAPEGLRQLDAAIAGPQGRRAGDRRGDQPRNRSADTEKNGMTNRKIQYWVIPPEADAEFVAAMEAVLDTYENPYDPAHPVLCMDEQPVQLIKQTRHRIPGTRRRAEPRPSTTSTSGPARRTSFCSPSRWLVGRGDARATKTKADWAVAIAHLMEGRYRSVPP